MSGFNDNLTKQKIMKKIFASLFAIAAIVGCAQNDIEEIAPKIPLEKGVMEVGTAGEADDASRATFDKALQFSWEAGDRMAVLQGCTGAPQQSLTLTGGEGTTSARFRSEEFEYVANTTAAFHFVYPASCATLTTSGATVALPAQDGVWNPILVASTEPTTHDAIENVDLQSLTGCLGIRVFSNNKSDALAVKSISVKAENNFLGEFVGTVGSDGKMTYTPNGTTNQFTVNVADMASGVIDNEYRFEVLPVDAGVVTVTLTDENDNVITLSTSGNKLFKAHTITRINVAWNPTVSLGGVTTWYEETIAGKESTLNGGDVQFTGVTANGGKVTHIAWKYNEGEAWNLLELNDKQNLKLTGIGSGTYYVCAAIQAPDGTWNYSPESYQVTVTAKPTVTYKARSTYAYNDGTSVRQNVLADRTSIIYESYTISNSDDFTNALLNTSAAKFVYGSSEWDANTAGTVNSALALGQYGCYVKIPFVENSAVSLESENQNIYVTGVPYSVSGEGVSSISGWTNSSTTDTGNYLLIKDGGSITSPSLFYASTNCTYDIVLSSYVYCYRGSYTSATYRLSMQMNPSIGATFSEDLSGGILLDNTTSGYRFVEKTLNTTLSQNSGIKISTSKVSSRGLAVVTTPGMNIDVISVRYR